MSYSNDEIKTDLKNVLYAREGKSPSYIGMPKNGTLTYSENILLATAMHELMMRNDFSATGLSSYKGNFDDGKKADIAPKQTYQQNLSYNMHYAFQEGRDDSEEIMWQTEQIKQTALDTFNLHVENDPYETDRERKLNYRELHAQKMGFADYATFKALMEMPGKAPSIRELITDYANSFLAPKEDQWKHNRRKHAIAYGHELSLRVLESTIELPVDHKTTLEEQTYKNKKLQYL